MTKHTGFSDAYMQEHPMPSPDAQGIAHLNKVLDLVGGYVLHGHKWAYCARILFVQGYLKLESVDDRRRGSYNPPKEIDLAHIESISTYDELARVEISRTGELSIHISEATESFRAHPAKPRAVFHLTGDWWRLWNYSDTLVKRLDEKLNQLANSLREAEEIAQQIKRRNEIRTALLAGEYEPEDFELGEDE